MAQAQRRVPWRPCGGVPLPLAFYFVSAFLFSVASVLAFYYGMPGPPGEAPKFFGPTGLEAPALPGPLIGSSGAPRKAFCHSWARKGECSFGGQCRYPHDPSEAGVGVAEMVKRLSLIHI